jgi:hypothetical protein
MKAIAQQKNGQLFEEINALQAASRHYLDSTSINPLVRRWRALKHEIDALMKVDACSAWELAGAWKGLSGDLAATEEAFANSAKLGNSGTNRINWMVNRLNLGLFSGAQALYAEVGTAEDGYFTQLLEEGCCSGAIQQAVRFIERAGEMHIKGNADLTTEIIKANAILQVAGLSDACIAQHLDVAGLVLRRHRIRPDGTLRVTSAPGYFNGVTYAFKVPVPAESAFDMNIELAEEEDRAGIDKHVAFDVVFEPLSS